MLMLDIRKILCSQHHSLENQVILICCLCSVSEVFPPVSLNFAGGASMLLKPEEYLINLGFYVSFHMLAFS